MNIKLPTGEEIEAALTRSSPIGHSSNPQHAVRLRELIGLMPDDKLALMVQLALAAVTDMDYLSEVGPQVDRTGAELLAFMQTDLLSLSTVAEQARGWYDEERIAALKAARG